MTYYNIVFRAGHERFARASSRHGVAGAILPDLPLEECGPWARGRRRRRASRRCCWPRPTAPDERLPRICARSRGFVYGVGLLGVTGSGEALADSAIVMAKRLKAVTDLPVLIGVGVSTPEQAVEVCRGGRRRGRGLGARARAARRGRPERALEASSDGFRKALDAAFSQRGLLKGPEGRNA